MEMEVQTIHTHEGKVSEAWGTASALILRQEIIGHVQEMTVVGVE